jgi:hypothetical protein
MNWSRIKMAWSRNHNFWPQNQMKTQNFVNAETVF